MIAIATPSTEEIQREFEEMLPELSSRLHYRLFEHGPDRQAEFVAEGIALSWQAFLSARRRGKEITAGNLAWFAVRSVLSGRRLAGASSLDAMSDRPLARERIGERVSLHDLPDGTAFHRTWADRRWKWPILEYAMLSIDWTDFRKGLSDRDRVLLDLRLAGTRQKAIAEVLNVTPARICQRLVELRRKWEDFQGDAETPARAVQADDMQPVDSADAAA